MKKLPAIVVLLFWIVGNGFGQCDSIKRLDSYCASTVIGHRGYSHNFPENTLVALEEAFKHGVKICEVDISLTADSVYVLFHDNAALSRVSSSLKTINEVTYAEVSALDVGKWKDQGYNGYTVPLLKDALKLAEKYDAQLYLDTKDYVPERIAQALAESGAQPHRLAPSLESIEQAITFRSILPHSPWVWYGGGTLPEYVDSAGFYIACSSLGCQALEVNWYEALNDSNMSKFITRAHSLDLKIWAFTVNDNKIAHDLIGLGVDALETDRPVALANQLCGTKTQPYADSLCTGNWRFVNSLKNSKGNGSQVRPLHYKIQDSLVTPKFNTCLNFGISPLTSIFDSVMFVPAQNDSTGGLLVYTNFSVDDNGTRDRTHTIMMDFLVPMSSMGKWVALYQTSPGNSDDADLFIHPNGKIGVSGQYFGSVSPNTWYRLIASYDGNQELLSIYMNGLLMGRSESGLGRQGLYNSAPSGENQGFLLFTDNNNETGDVYISGLQVRDYNISDHEAAILNGASNLGFPSHNADILFIDSPQLNPDSTLLDYDNQSYSVYVDSGLTGLVNFSYTASAGSIPSLPSGTPIDLSLAPIYIQVVSQDGTNIKNWTICARNSDFTGINKVNQPGNALRLQPNPAENWLKLTANQNMTSLFVMNTAGKKVISRELENVFSTTINLEDSLPAGVYVITVKYTDGSQEAKKFVKLR